MFTIVHFNMQKANCTQAVAQVPVHTIKVITIHNKKETTVSLASTEHNRRS